MYRNWIIAVIIIIVLVIIYVNRTGDTMVGDRHPYSSSPDGTGEGSAKLRHESKPETSLQTEQDSRSTNFLPNLYGNIYDSAPKDFKPLR